MKIKAVYLINDMPLDIIRLEWCKPSYKKMYEIIHNYKSLGYVVLFDKTYKNNKHDIVYGVNSKYHIEVIKDYE